MALKLLFVVLSGGARQLLTVVKCCACKERSGLVSDYSTPITCFRHGCEHNYCSNCEWLVEGQFQTIDGLKIVNETKPDFGQDN